ncbi:MAG TPA: 3-hydroxybutyryl-CoA dehydrogenase [Mycobacteriales bacterium]|jgi:3-hydroxybutyryl-CoA dehydrogenase|nr:3-hydroxybutyryl-CoA dehydrogenase [Mycobacteriales bacterium]
MEAVGVVGSGIMGAGIAEVAARSGCDVLIREVTAELAEKGRSRIAASLERAVSRGTLSEADRDATLARVRTTTSLPDLADRDLVIEAIVEDEPTKTALYRELSGLVRPDCLLASNTSSIPISRLAAASEHPERVLGMHFFNPVPVLPLVELVPSLLTGQSSVDTARAFAEDRLGKRTVLCQDRAGFVVNALLVPYLLAAIRMVEAGVATAEDVDAAMVGGANHPMGPLALTDLIGLDTTAAVAVSMYEEFKEPLYAAPPLLRRMVEAGRLGRKSGRGFFDYS